MERGYRLAAMDAGRRIADQNLAHENLLAGHEKPCWMALVQVLVAPCTSAFLEGEEESLATAQAALDAATGAGADDLHVSGMRFVLARGRVEPCGRALYAVLDR